MFLPQVYSHRSALNFAEIYFCLRSEFLFCRQGEVLFDGVRDTTFTEEQRFRCVVVVVLLLLLLLTIHLGALHIWSNKAISFIER